MYLGIQLPTDLSELTNLLLFWEGAHIKNYHTITSTDTNAGGGWFIVATNIKAYEQI